jgi:hypothetical protein
VQFTEDAIEGIVAGRITLTFRNWTRALAKVSSRHRVWGELIEIDDVRTVEAQDVTEAEARAAGAASRAALLTRLGVEPGRQSERPIWRVAFHHVGPDDRIERRNEALLTDERRAEIQQRLDRMDRAGAGGAWTAKALRLIATYPGVVSTVLARRVGRDRAAFKTDVRKLKELGLTESLEVGYRLSPLGRAFLGTVDGMVDWSDVPGSDDARQDDPPARRGAPDR